MTKYEPFIQEQGLIWRLLNKPLSEGFWDNFENAPLSTRRKIFADVCARLFAVLEIDISSDAGTRVIAETLPEHQHNRRWLAYSPAYVKSWFSGKNPMPVEALEGLINWLGDNLTPEAERNLRELHGLENIDYRKEWQDCWNDVMQTQNLANRAVFCRLLSEKTGLSDRLLDNLIRGRSRTDIDTITLVFDQLAPHPELPYLQERLQNIARVLTEVSGKTSVSNDEVKRSVVLFVRHHRKTISYDSILDLFFEITQIKPSSNKDVYLGVALNDNRQIKPELCLAVDRAAEQHGVAHHPKFTALYWQNKQLSAQEVFEAKPRFGILLRAVRELLNLTQTELADAVGISHSYVSHVESGKHGLAKEALSRLFEVLKERETTLQQRYGDDYPLFFTSDVRQTLEIANRAERKRVSKPSTIVDVKELKIIPATGTGRITAPPARQA